MQALVMDPVCLTGNPSTAATGRAPRAGDIPESPQSWAQDTRD